MFKAPFSFRGRIRRIEYFLSGFIACVFISVALLFAAFLWIIPASNANFNLGVGAALGIMLLFFSWIACVWFSLAQGVKRLHDLDKSGWLFLLCFIPLVGWLFALYMLFADGTVGPNQYGDDPKNRMPYQPQPASVNVTVNIAKDGTVEAETGMMPPKVTADRVETSESTER